MYLSYFDSVNNIIVASQYTSHITKFMPDSNLQGSELWAEVGETLVLEALHSYFKPHCHLKMFRNSGSEHEFLTTFK
jgi:hypothetical protein